MPVKIVKYKCEICEEKYEDKLDASRCELHHEEEGEV